MRAVTFDCETEAIVGNPLVSPPRMVGYAVLVPDQEPVYLAWGHPTENNCDFGDAREYARKLVRDTQLPFIFHNAPFDIACMADSLSLPWYFFNGGWKRVHDTMYLLFLRDPYSRTFALKPGATRWLGTPPVEQTELRNWILANISESTPSTWGEFISRAPGDLVGRYAIGDIVRTRGLFDLLYKWIEEQQMVSAYDRERALMPRLVKATQHGIRIDRERLEKDEVIYTKELEKCENSLASKLGITVEQLHDDSALADGLERSGAVTQWVLTKTGKRSMSKDNLRISDPEIKNLMTYRGKVATCLQMFMRPWLQFSGKENRVHPNWNQVRQAKGEKDSKGARTGRLSSDEPNFQNVPNTFLDKKHNPLIVPEGLLPFPRMRVYCLPEVGHVWLKRDFSSQEVRILAHFEDGQLCEAYRGNPNLDPHQMAMELIQNLVGILYSRPTIKITGFSIIYGSGINGLSGQLEIPYHEAGRIRYSYLAAMPGVKDLMDDVKGRGERGEPIRTWGGRLYYAEIGSDGRNFAYKLLNYLIQGSAADQTKESINDWFENKPHDDVFLATVHDEINISAPSELWQNSMGILRVCMERDRFDVPFRSEGFYGPNWSEIEALEEN